MRRLASRFPTSQNRDVGHPCVVRGQAVGVLRAAAELNDAAPIALARPVRGQGRKLLHGFALCCNAQAGLAAGVSLAVEGLRHRCRTADVADGEHIDFKAAGVVFDLQAVAGMDIACGFGAQAIRIDPAHIASARGYGAGFEEARGPEPFVDANLVHSRSS